MFITFFCLFSCCAVKIISIEVLGVIFKLFFYILNWLSVDWFLKKTVFVDITIASAQTLVGFRILSVDIDLATAFALDVVSHFC